MILLEWILRANHEPDLLQAGMLVNMVGNDQVPVVNRIKGSEVESDFHKAAVILPPK